MHRYDEISEKQAITASEISNELTSLISGSPFNPIIHESTMDDFWFLIIAAVQKSEQLHKYWLQLAEAKFQIDYKDKPTVFWARERTEEFQSSDIPRIIASSQEIQNLSLMALDFLSAQGADIEYSISYFGHTPLSKSLYLETDALTLKILELGANPNGLVTKTSPAFNSNFESMVQSPLTIAAGEHLKRFRSIEALLDHGADVNFREFYLQKGGKKKHMNKAINLVLHQYIASFEFISTSDRLHHDRVVKRVVEHTKFRYLELARIFLFGPLVLP